MLCFCYACAMRWYELCFFHFIMAAYNIEKKISFLHRGMQ